MTKSEKRQAEMVRQVYNLGRNDHAMTAIRTMVRATRGNPEKLNRELIALVTGTTPATLRVNSSGDFV
tara:strand:+ start:197 stop:400 length:204 start_codon:yes stop_codon:yes gene_type:complete